MITLKCTDIGLVLRRNFQVHNGFEDQRCKSRMSLPATNCLPASHTVTLKVDNYQTVTPLSCILQTPETLILLQTRPTVARFPVEPLNGDEISAPIKSLEMKVHLGVFQSVLQDSVVITMSNTIWKFLRRGKLLGKPMLEMDMRVSGSQGGRERGFADI